MGFDPPLGGWLRHELRPWAEDLLRSPRCVEEGWLDRAALRTTWDQHVSGRRNNEYPIWGVLMLEQWLATHHPR
jgi:asparagine synthase (glutamine-hydrolysing)